MGGPRAHTYELAGTGWRVGRQDGRTTVGDVDGGTQLGLDALDPAFVPRPLLRVTPARLATWVDCPRRYRLTYVDRPAPPRSGARAANTLGAVVHLALRSYYDLPAPRRTPDAAAALVDRHWSAEGFRDAAQAAGYRLRAREWVADYVTGAGAGATPVALERWVSVPTPRIVAEGRVDRIDRRPAPDRTDELVVVDYKTGQAPTPDDALRSPALALYAVAARHTLHRPCSRVELHHVPTGEVAAATHDEASLHGHLTRAADTAEEAADAADALAAGGDRDTLFPPRPAARCGSCDVRRHCPEGRAAAPEREPWASLTP
jgi:putative RecB family exonuclease